MEIVVSAPNPAKKPSGHVASAAVPTPRESCPRPRLVLCSAYERSIGAPRGVLVRMAEEGRFPAYRVIGTRRYWLEDEAEQGLKALPGPGDWRQHLDYVESQYAPRATSTRRARSRRSRADTSTSA